MKLVNLKNGMLNIHRLLTEIIVSAQVTMTKLGACVHQRGSRKRAMSEVQVLLYAAFDQSSSLRSFLIRPIYCVPAELIAISMSRSSLPRFSANAVDHGNLSVAIAWK